MNKQPEALRLADELWDWSEGPTSLSLAEQAAAELSRLHEVNQMLQLALRDLLNDSEPCDCAPDDRHCPVIAARTAIAKAGETK